MLPSFLRNLMGIDDVTQILRERPMIIDVRTPEEYAAGHIPQALNIPIEDLSHSLAKLSDISSPLVLYCASGSRSSSAKQLLLQHGYTRVYNAGSMHDLEQMLQRSSW